MLLGVSNGLIFAIAASAIVWLSLSFGLMPRMRKELFRSAADAASGIGARIAGAAVIRDVSFTALIAGALVLIGAFYLKQQLKSYEATETGVQNAVALRDSIETLLGRMGNASAGLWLAATAGLALLWLLLARSNSRRRWQKAIDARKAALLTLFQNKTSEELRAELASAHPEALAKLEGEAERIKASNQRLVDGVRGLGVLSGAGFTLSYNQLLEMAAKTAEELAAPAAEGQEESRKERETVLAAVRKHISEIEQGLTVELAALGGQTRKVMLAEALVALAPTQENFDNAMRNALVEERTRNHLADANSKARTEPELLREWLGAGLTSEAAVESASRMGRFSGAVALTCMFLGLVGLGSTYTLSAGVLNLQSLELSLTLSAEKAKIEAAASEPKTELDGSQLASNADTVTYLQQSFRSSLARSIASSLGQQLPRSSRQAIYEIASADARDKILHLSSRSAAQPLDPGATPQRFEARVDHPVENTSRAAALLDRALDDRI